MIMDMMDTHIPAPPRPATARPKIRKFTEGATAQNRLPSSNIATVTRKTFFAGAIASTRPKKSMKPACIFSTLSESVRFGVTASHLWKKVGTCYP